MSDSYLDATGVGNAIVDVLAKADDAFLADHKIIKGGMELVDEERARAIYDVMGSAVEISGGAAANTIAAIASLGGKGGFVGKVAKDTLGEIFRHDLRAMGVEFDSAPLTDGPATGRCLINVTPDAQRSMTTFLGAAGFITPTDIDEDQIRRTSITFYEGYQMEIPRARDAFMRASKIAKDAGRRAALTLSDSHCVEREFDAFHAFIKDHVDIVLANEAEAKVLFREDNFDAIPDKARGAASLVAVTRSEKGSVLIPENGDVIEVPAVPPTALVDTTGAGDAYAAGLLFGLARGFELKRAGEIASLAASEVISHFGARPETPLKDLAEAAGLL